MTNVTLDQVRAFQAAVKQAEQDGVPVQKFLELHEAAKTNGQSDDQVALMALSSIVDANIDAGVAENTPD